MRLLSVSEFTSHRETEGEVIIDQNNQMTERDWSIILSDAKKITVEDNTQIVFQGKQNFSLYQLISGKLRVSKSVDRFPFFYI